MRGESRRERRARHSCVAGRSERRRAERRVGRCRPRRPASPSLAQFKGVRSGERRGETRGHALLQASPEVILLALFLDARRLSLREALLVERLRDARGWGSARHGHGSKPIPSIFGRLRSSRATRHLNPSARFARRDAPVRRTRPSPARAHTRGRSRGRQRKRPGRETYHGSRRSDGDAAVPGVVVCSARSLERAVTQARQTVKSFTIVVAKLQLFLLTSPRRLLASSSRTSLSANVPKREPFCETNISRITIRRPSPPRPLFACATNARAGPGRPPRAAIACPPRRARDKLAIQTRPIRPTRSPATCA